MEDKMMCSNDQSKAEVGVERDLWAALLHAEGITCSWQMGAPLTEAIVAVEENPSDRITYPWDPSEPETDAFFEHLGEPSIFADWEPNEIATRAKAFFDQISHLWESAADNSLQVSLTERFVNRIPQALIADIANRAQQLVSSSLSLADQLVQCAQASLPNLMDLVEEDLYVLARPLAGAMRDGEVSAVESALAAVRPIQWEELSETEQARLSLAVARFALAELEKH